MRTIGIFGGFSPYSTLRYYQLINDAFIKNTHSFHTPTILIYHMNPAPIIDALHKQDWAFIQSQFLEVGKKLVAAGAKLLVIPCHSLQKIIFFLEEKLGVSCIPIMTVIGNYARDNGYSRLLLLGTMFTMQSQFYIRYLSRLYHVDVITPDPADQQLIHALIFNQLCHGSINKSVTTELLSVIDKYDYTNEIDAVILGCTELSLIDFSELKINYIDALQLHVDRIVQLSRS